MRFGLGACNKTSHLPFIILPDARALPLQAIFRTLKFGRRTPPSPISIVMTDPDQNQVGKSLTREHFGDLPRKVACPKHATKQILPVLFVIDQRADAAVL